MAASVRVVQEVRIAAPPARVWRALTADVAEWWPREFHTRPGSKGMRLEVVPGGRFWEDWGDGGGLLWGTVVGVKENELLQTAGELFPEYGGPARLLTTWTLMEEAGATALRLVDCAFGDCGSKLAESLERGWKTICVDSLKPWVEKRG